MKYSRKWMLNLVYVTIILMSFSSITLGADNTSLARKIVGKWKQKEIGCFKYTRLEFREDGLMRFIDLIPRSGALKDNCTDEDREYAIYTRPHKGPYPIDPKPATTELTYRYKINDDGYIEFEPTKERFEPRKQPKTKIEFFEQALDDIPIKAEPYEIISVDKNKLVLKPIMGFREETYVRE